MKIGLNEKMLERILLWKFAGNVGLHRSDLSQGRSEKNYLWPQTANYHRLLLCKQHYQNKSWQILNRQVGIIIARGTMDPRVDCSCLSQSLNKEQGIIPKSFTAITMKWSSHSEKNLPQSCGHSVIHLSLSFCQMTKSCHQVVSSCCWACKSSIDQISPISVS